MHSRIEETEVVVVGAGPIGLETAFELKRAGIPYLHFDQGQIGSTIAWFPEGMTFFSSTDRIAIAGVPIQTVNQTKATKEEYLAYLRTVALTHDLAVRTFEEVTAIEHADEGFLVRSQAASGEHQTRARKVVLAIGDMHGPRLLGVPGEELPHVSHYFRNPHTSFRRRLLVVGGRNSAVEAALRCWHAGAEVTLSYRRAAFDAERAKYWLLPELLGRIRRGEMECHCGTEVVRITPTEVELRRSDGSTFPVAADQVLLLTGYVPDTRLLEGAGVEFTGAARRPTVDAGTMETNVPGLYVAGTVVGGQQETYTVFIETCHIHARRIAAAITGASPPAPDEPRARPES
jgi:bacillithiol disulfide reductase